MNSASSLPTTQHVKPPPLPKARGLAVVPPPAPVEDVEDDLEVTAVAETPPEVLREARSDVRELRAPRPTPPRPSGMPRPHDAGVRRSGPPPLPAAVAPVSWIPMPAATSTPVPPPAPRPEVASELEITRPRPLLVARTAWFFAVFVMTDAFRWLVERLSHARAWLAAEWRHAAIRAEAQRR